MFRVRHVVRGAAEAGGRPGGAHDVYTQAGANGPGRVPQDTEVQELHGGHGQQVTAPPPLLCPSAGGPRLPQHGAEIQPGAPPLQVSLGECWGTSKMYKMNTSNIFPQSEFFGNTSKFSF